jgi:flagellar hook-associated protein 2
MSTITSPTYDPASTATALAQKYTAAAQDALTIKTKDSAATAKGLTDLGSAISNFQSSLASLTGLNKSLVARSATFSDTTIGTASASATATAGTYAFFVKQVATASQVSYAGLTDDVAISGNLVVKLGGGAGGSITVDLATANTDGGALSVREIAAAINAAVGNTSLVSASVVTTGGTSELVLSAKNTGAASAITLDTSAITGASSLATANVTPARVHQLALAQDAEIRLGSETGTAIIQATNSFTNVAGVTMTFTKAQASGTPPVTLTVAPNDGGTQANVQAFIDAYNKLRRAVDTLVDPGDPSKNVAGGVFAHDGGMRALRDRLVSLVRPGGGSSLAAYGIIAERDGTLSLKADALTRKLAADPTGLDTLIGSASASAPSGVAGALDTFLKSWNNSVSGQILKRKQVNDSLQKTLTDRQTQLDTQYNSAYQRYLLQFTKLQTLQSQMTNNASMFDALFGNNKSD